jgi:lysine 6-dehydrogenase
LMKIFVLGAGRMGSVVVMDLARSGIKNGIEIGIGDVELARAKNISSRYENVDAFKTDVNRPEELVGVLKKYDAVVNATWYEFNIQIMKACFKARCNYTDLGGLFHTTRKQLALDQEAKHHSVSAIVGGGESPGITNVMAKLCADELSSIERIRIFVGARERPKQKTFSDLSFPFSVSTVIDEYSKNPVEFLDGKFVEVPPLSGIERVEFPQPVGTNTVHYSIHSEPATLPYSVGKGVKNVEFKLGISEAMVNALRPLIEMGFTSEEKIPVNGTSVSPKGFIVGFFNKTKPGDGNNSERFVSLKTIVSGMRGRRPRKVQAQLVSGPKKEIGLNNATAYLTGTAGSIFGQLLARDVVNEKGVFAPESAVDPRKFLSELEVRGIRITK